jgi:hypothetical protein
MKAMRKYFIAALVLAAGCGSTRRDFSVCDQTYKECGKGFACNFATGMCEPDLGIDGGPDTNVSPSETGTPVDVTPVEVATPDTKDAPVIDVAPVDVVPTDVPITDVPITEAGGPDLRVPDAPGTCAVDGDCTGSGRPFCVSGMCVACKTSNQCNNDAGAPFCSAQNTCVSCAAATGDGGVCSGAAPMCDPGSGRCLECVHNSDCPTAAKAFCVANQCQGCSAPGASAGGGVSDGGVRDGGRLDAGGIDAGVLGPCVGAKPVCATSGTLLGQCVQCMDSGDCAGSTPICSSANTCTTCTTDSQCASIGGGPGICMFHQDGRCAAESETIYVKNSSTCSGGSGTHSSPYCDTQTGVNAVTTSRRVIVVEGPAADGLSAVASTPSGSQISIIGENIATTSAGAAIGIHVTAGDVFVRGVTVANGTSKAGIVVESGATLRLDRCIIKNNVGGGLIVQAGASFDVANSVFDNNGPGVVSGVINFGGVYLGGSAPSSGPHRFWFSTIVNNQDRGVICYDNTQALSGMLLYGNVNGGWQNCTMDSTNSKWDSPGTGSDVSDPAFSATNPYHLTSSSHCRDYINASLAHPSDDIDGDSRPKPATGKLDCGADEY